jgi:SAM-dependent methyltransferase
MNADIVDLRDFYTSRLGQVACRMIRRRIRLVWPEIAGSRVLGIGYATPYLRPFLTDAERVMAMMPAAQGVLPWPAEGPNRVTLVEESELPLADYSIDRVVLVHSIEFSEELRPLLKEVWRVLAAGGRLLAIVPNRRGIWARIDRTPFGQGHPYTPGQLSRLLREEGFTPERNAAALFVPPTHSRLLLRAAPVLERLGERWFATFAGVAMVEASKQIYATTPQPRRQRVRTRQVYIPIGHGTPSPIGR